MKKFLLAAALACTATAWAATDWVAGEIVRLDPARKLVVLKHERIPDLDMDAMTMRFKVEDVEQLAPLKAGDKVRFRVDLKDGEPVVLHIEAQP